MKFLNKFYLLLSLALLPIITNLKSEILPGQITPENTIFAFDLHDVVLKTQTYKATIDFIKKFPHLTYGATCPALIRLTYRSEERREGKECSERSRSRWSPYH